MYCTEYPRSAYGGGANVGLSLCPILMTPLTRRPRHRTDFKKNSLTTASAISHWVSSALADTSVSRRLSSGDPDSDWDRAAASAGAGVPVGDGGGTAAGGPAEAPPAGWVSSMARWARGYWPRPGVEVACVASGSRSLATAICDLMPLC